MERPSFKPSRGVDVVFNQCLFKHSLRNWRSFPKASEGNNTASECGGVKTFPSYLPTSLPLLLLFFSHLLSTSPHFLLTPGALVCSLACSISPPGKRKGTSATQANSSIIPDFSPNTIEQSSCNLLPPVLTVDPDSADATLS